MISQEKHSRIIPAQYYSTLSVGWIESLEQAICCSKQYNLCKSRILSNNNTLLISKNLWQLDFFALCSLVVQECNAV